MSEYESEPVRTATVSLPFLFLMALGAVGLFLGWNLFWFLTDDAFIEYRYVSNSILGHGYVWNAPPFLPVEGYTSFLWVALLDIVWRMTGVEPPRSANLISLLFSYGSLVLTASMIMRVPWTPVLKRFRLWFVALFLAGVLSNRTFLAWTSSGLETAMFNFYVTLWIFVVLLVRSPLQKTALASLASALLALTRPDGLLFVAGMWMVMLLLARAAPDWKSALRVLWVGSLPLVVVLAHLLWRHGFYGSWLPNTYYAKVVEPWPSNGIRYAASFVLEYGVWLPIIITVAATIHATRRPSSILRHARAEWKRRNTFGSIVTIAITVSALHLAYYTFVVGGDHFEYRAYSHAVPLLYVALVYAMNSLALKPLAAGLLMAASVLVSEPVPWTHWAMTRHLDTRKETLGMFVPIAPAWPPMFRWYADLFDGCQSWLRERSTCVRHQEHKVFWRFQVENHPSRDEGMMIPRDGFPVYVVAAVGMPAWVLPNVNLIDSNGLNDYVIARTPYPRGGIRKMAHGRRAPAGYAESYRPNFTADGRILARLNPLTAGRITCLEAYWRSRLPEIQQGTFKFDGMVCAD